MLNQTISVARAGPRIDMRGKKYGRLLVLHQSGYLYGGTAWECLCDCGTTIRAHGRNLRTGNTQSCGCRQLELVKAQFTEHGMSDTPIHSIWMTMINRCHSPGSESYVRYGARGIEVCDSWRYDFTAFYRDMGDRPEGKTLDREDNDGHYCKANCRWATATEQANNKRNVPAYTYKGVTQTLTQWARGRSIPPATLRARLNRYK